MILAMDATVPGIILGIIGIGLILVSGLLAMRLKLQDQRESEQAMFQHTEEQLNPPYDLNNQQPRCYPIYKEPKPGDDPRRADEV